MVRIGLLLLLPAGLAVLAMGVYRLMIDVKPGVPRPAMGPAVQTEMAALRDRLMEHVRVLAGRIGERHLERPEALQAAAEYIREVWAGQGFAVEEEAFAVAGRRCANLVAERKGSTLPGEIVLAGAHYDSIIGSPGANDNATGVAVLLELSRALRGRAPARTVRFVAFVNEEPPHFMTEAMGSRVHARRARARGERIAAPEFARAAHGIITAMHRLADGS